MDEMEAIGALIHQETLRQRRQEYELQTLQRMVERVCHELSGTCVMVLGEHKGPHHTVCDVANCSAYRAAFAPQPQPTELGK